MTNLLWWLLAGGGTLYLLERQPAAPAQPSSVQLNYGGGQVNASQNAFSISLPQSTGDGTGLPAGYTWVEQGNTAPVNPMGAINGNAAQAAILAPDGSTISIVGLATDAGPSLVTFTHVPDGSWNATIGPVQLPLSYVVPHAQQPSYATPGGAEASYAVPGPIVGRTW